METIKGVIVALTLGLTAIAQAKVRVRCVDDDGKPVSGAEVWLWQSRQLPNGKGEQLESGPFRTGDDGTTSTAVGMTWGGGKFDRWVYARIAGKLVGARRSMHMAGDKQGEPIEVLLRPSREIRGRVRVPDGFDPP